MMRMSNSRFFSSDAACRAFRTPALLYVPVCCLHLHQRHLNLKRLQNSETRWDKSKLRRHKFQGYPITPTHLAAERKVLLCQARRWQLQGGVAL